MLYGVLMIHPYVVTSSGSVGHFSIRSLLVKMLHTDSYKLDIFKNIVKPLINSNNRI